MGHKWRKVTRGDAPVVVKRDLKLIHATAYVVGTVIGSGIFISPKGILSNVRSVGFALVMWAFCALVSCLGALLFVEFSLGITKAGGTYVYIKTSIGGTIAFLNLWTYVLATRPSTMAVQSMTAASYLLQSIYGEGCTFPVEAQRLVAASSLLFLAILNAYKVKLGAGFQVLTTIAKVSGLVVIIVTGWIYLGRGSHDSFQNAFADSTSEVGAIGLAFYSGMWSYAGYDNIVVGVTEVNNPKRNIPLSIIGGVLFVLVMYMLTNVAYLAVVSPAELLAVDAVAVTFSEKAFGRRWSWFIPLVVCTSIIGSLNTSFFSYSRIMTAGANEKQIPRVFAMINVHRYTPVPSIITSTAVAALMLSLLGIFQLINWLSFLLWVDQAMTAAGLIWMRYKGKTEGWPYRFPWICHLLYFIVCAVFSILPFFKDPWNCIKGMILIVSGIPVYFLFIRKTAPFKHFLSNSRGLKKLTDGIQKYLVVVLPDEQIESEIARVEL